MKCGDLVAGDLAAFARLAPLRDLDLELLGHREIAGGDAEPARRHLLDLGVGDVGPGSSYQSWSSPPFAGVGAGAEPVHGDGQRPVRLGTERAERHRGDDEALDDGLRRLDLVEWYGLARRHTRIRSRTAVGACWAT